MLLRRRDKARQLFSDGLQMALPDVPGGDVAFASAEVECAMYAASGGVNKEYVKISRRLSFNIKDANNPDLRRKVLAGDVTGKRSPLHIQDRFHTLHVRHTLRVLMVSARDLCHDFSPEVFLPSTWFCCCSEYDWWCETSAKEVCAGEDLVNMSPEELASDARKSQNAAIRKEALKESERGQHLKKVGDC